MLGGTVTELVNGSGLLTSSTGNNGAYYILLPSGTITASSQVLTYTTSGVAFAQNASGSVSGLNIYGTFLNELTASTNVSGISGLATAYGSNSAVQAEVNGLANLAISPTGTSFTVNQAISTGIFALAPTTAAMVLGSGSGVVVLDQAGLNNITASTIILGSPSSTGAISVSSTVTLPASTINLSLVTAGTGITIGSGVTLQDTHNNGTITLQANSVTFASPTTSLIKETGSNGTVAILPATAATTMSLAGSGTLNLPSTVFSNSEITAATLIFGATADTGGLTVAANTTLTSSLTNLDLINSAITIGSGVTLNDPNVNGTVTLQANTLSFGSATTSKVQETGSGGIVDIFPVTATTTMSLAGSGTLNLPATVFSNSEITAATLIFGNTADTGGLTVAANTTLTSNITNLDLIMQGTITISAGTTLTDPNNSGTITLQANKLTFSNTSTSLVKETGTNSTVAIFPVTATTAMSLAGSAALNLPATVFSNSEIVATTLIFGNTADTGGLTVAANTALKSGIITNLDLIMAGTITISAGTTLSDPNNGGTITLEANKLTFTNATTSKVQETGTGSTVAIFPVATTTAMSLAGSAALNLPATVFSNSEITATTLVFGATADTGGITVAGSITVPSTITNLSLISGGAVSVNAALTDSNASGTLTLQGSGLTLAASVTANSSSGTVVLNTAGTATQSAGIITAANLLLLGSGGSFTLTDSNAVGVLAANTGSVNFTDSIGLSIGAVAGTNGVTATTLTLLDSGGNISQTQVISVTGTSSFTTSASNATIALNSANALAGAVSLNTSGTSGNASLTNNQATQLGASNVGGNLIIIDSIGSLTQSGVLTVGGTSSFTTSASNATIALTQANLLTGAVSLNTNGTTGNASLTNNQATVLGASTVNGNLIVIDSIGNLTQSGVLTVTGTSSFTTSASNATITLGSANLLTGAVSLNTSGTTGNASLTNNKATQLGASNVGGNLIIIDSTGNLTQTGVLTVAGTSSFTTSAANATITLNSANLPVGAVSLNTSGTTGNASLTNNQATQLGASNVGGNLIIIDSIGSLTQSGVLTVSGTSSFTTSASNATITLTQANLLTGAVSLSTNGTTGNASLTNNQATQLGASTVNGNLIVIDSIGNLTQTAGVLTVTGTSSFTTSAANATITLSSANALSGAVSLNTNGATGDASLTNNKATQLGVSNVGGNLIIIDSIGSLTQSGVLTVGGTSSFTTSALNATITLTSANLLTGAVSLNTNGTTGNASLTNNQTTQLGASTVNGNLIVIDSIGNLTQTAGVLTVTGTSSFTTSASNATITLNSANALTGAVSLNTNGTTGNASLTNNQATVLGASTVGGNLTVIDSIGNLTQSGVLTVGGTSSFTTSASNATIALTQANLLTGAVSLNTNGTTGNASLTNNQATVLGASTVNGNLIVIDSIGNLTQTAGVLTVTGTSSFTTSASNATITLGSANALTGAVSLNTSGTSGNASLTNNKATQLGASNVGGNLIIIDSVGNLTQSGVVTVGGTSSFTTSASNATIALTLANLLTGAVSLNTAGTTGNASLTNNKATQLAASTIGGNLTVIDSIGNLTQSGVLTVGGTSSFTTSASNATITLNSANALTGAVSLNTNGTTGNASLTNNQATVLGASTVNGNLIVIDSIGNLTQSGVLTVTGTSSFTTSASNATIALTQANLLTGAVSLNTSGASGNASLTNNKATQLAASTIGGNLIVIDSIGNLTQSGVLTVGGTSSFTTSAANATITLNSANALTGAVSLNTSGTTGNASLTNNQATQLAASNVGGNLIVIDSIGNLTQSGVLTVGGTSSFTTSAANATIALGSTNLLTGAVSLNTTGTSGNASLTNGQATVLGASTVGGTLTVTSTGTLNIAGAINAGGFTVTATGAITDTAAGINVGTFILAGGNWSQNQASLPSFSATDFRITGGTFLRAVGGTGASGSPYLIADVYGLQGIGTLVTNTAATDSFALANDIDASGTQNWNAGAGFAPINVSLSNQVFTFDGQNNAIFNLTINRGGSTNVGLFGLANATGNAFVVIENVGLIGGSITGGSDVGALIGQGDNNLDVLNSYSSANVTGSSTGIYTGGLIGLYSTPGSMNLDNIFATGNVTGGNQTGGLIGTLVSTGGTLQDAYATGNVSGTIAVGGLVGFFGVCTSCGNFTIAGINEVYANGHVSGTTSVGALIGVADTSSITSAYTGLSINAGLPGGFDDYSWGTVPGQTTPYLLFQLGVISGFATLSDRATPVNTGTTVGLTLNGVPQTSVQTIDANGAYSFYLGGDTAPGVRTIPANSQIFVSTSGGVTYVQSAFNNVKGASLYNSYFGEMTAATTLSSLNSSYASAISGLTALQLQISALPNVALFPTGASFTIDTTISTGVLAIAPPNTAISLGSGSGILVNQAALNEITASTLVLGGTTVEGGQFPYNPSVTVGSSVTLPTHLTNITLASGGTDTVGSGVTLLDPNANGTITLQANKLTFTSTTTSLVQETGAGGTVAILPASSVIPILGTVETMGLGTGTGAKLVLIQSELNEITATNLIFGSTGITTTMTVGGTVALPTTITNLSLLTGSTLTVNSGASLTDSNANATVTLQGSALNLAGSITVNNGANATLVLNTTGSANQTAGSFTATNLALLGSGGSYTLTGGNSVGTLAANTGSINFNDTSGLTIGTVAGTSGIASSGSVIVTTSGSLTIASGSRVVTTGTGNNIVLSALNNFINNEGSDAVSSSGRWLIYSNAPAGDTFGNLDSANTAVWNTIYPTAVAATGNRYVFAIQPTITFTSTDLTKTYGVDDSSAVASAYSVSGFQNGVTNAFLGDTIGSGFTGTPVLVSAGSAATAGVAGGPYAINITQGTVASTNGYALAFVSAGLLTVAPELITVTATSGQSKVYGFNDPTLAYSLTTGTLYNNDTLTGALTRADYGTLAGEQVGNHTITQGTLASSTNYTLSFTPGVTFAINAAAATATPDSGQHKTYGLNDPTLTYGTTGLVNGIVDGVTINDTLTGALTRADYGTLAGEQVGNHTITQGTLASSTNYTLSFTPGVTFAINAAAATATPDSGQHKTYGLNDPTLTYGTTGLVNGIVDGVTINDTLTGALTRADYGTLAGEQVGNHTITQGTLASSTNYTLSFTPGVTFAINTAAATATPDRGQHKT